MLLCGQLVVIIHVAMLTNRTETFLIVSYPVTAPLAVYLLYNTLSFAYQKAVFAVAIAVAVAAIYTLLHM